MNIDFLQGIFLGMGIMYIYSLMQIEIHDWKTNISKKKNKKGGVA